MSFLDRLFKRPLRLELEDRLVTFNSASDFEFALASRTDVPAPKIAELVGKSAAALEEEAGQIREVERRFIEVLSRSLEESGSIGYLLRELDLKLFSQDHGWRVIVSALNGQPREFDDFKQIAIVKYLQYLGARQDVLQSLYRNKGPMIAAAPVFEAAGQDPFKETVIFDVQAPTPAAAAAPAPPRLQRLPRGEAISVRVEPDHDVTVILSRHPFQLTREPSPALNDEFGTRHALKPGRSVVGRQPECDVVVDSGFRDVSRKHLLVEVEGGTFTLTDLSSHGTFVPPGVIDSTERP